jgi:hypothetical protein
MMVKEKMRIFRIFAKPFPLATYAACQPHREQENARNGHPQAENGTADFADFTDKKTFHRKVAKTPRRKKLFAPSCPGAFALSILMLPIGVWMVKSSGKGAILADRSVTSACDRRTAARACSGGL